MPVLRSDDGRFVSDGCTGFPDMWRGIDLSQCCLAHDLAWHYHAGDWTAWLASNVELANCFARAGAWELWGAVLVAVSTVGALIFMTKTKRNITGVTMRAKVKITGIQPYPSEGTPTQETLTFHFPAKDGPYPADGSDEDQSFARFSPAGALSLTVANPALLGKFAVGDKFYLDFKKIES